MEVFQATYHSREVKNINEIIKEAKLKGGEHKEEAVPLTAEASAAPAGREKEEEEDDKDEDNDTLR